MNCYKVVVSVTSSYEITYQVEAEDEWQAGDLAESEAELCCGDAAVTKISSTGEWEEYEATHVILIGPVGVGKN